MVQQPEHPYTRLLVSSIPEPDPDIAWEGERALGTPTGGLTPTGDSYCRFHERCPYAMPECVEQDPPFFRTSPRRATACYLFEEHESAPAGNLNMVLDKTAPASSAIS